MGYSRTYYLVQESLLAASYAPQNWYCFAVDAKSSPQFHSHLQQLASCLPNVFVANREWAMDSAGHNGTRAWLECMAELVEGGKQWEYAIVLQVCLLSLKVCPRLT